MSIDQTLLTRHVEILQHTLGARPDSPKGEHGYRNNFCAEIGSDDYRTCMELVENGLMLLGFKINEGRDQYFHASHEGCEAIGLSKKAIVRAFQY